MSLLEVRDLHAYYGKSHVLTGVNMSVDAGEIVAVLGRNGSGRSTTMKVLMGLVPAARGSIVLAGTDITREKPHAIAKRGLAYVPEERLVFDHLTVEENLIVGLQPSDHPPRWSIADMYAYFPRLKERTDTKAGNLSGGEQQMLTICRSLLCHPRVLLVDEPTEGLAPKIVEHLVDVIGDIAKRGIAVVLVEQKMTIALRIAPRCVVMGRGQIVFVGTPDALRADSSVRRTWLEVA
jgi:branched-chain amino acid transport system ATP-binding protein